MIILGLTGSIGMGKSVTASLLEECGVPVHDADREVHALMAPNGKAVPQIRQDFPEKTYPIYESDGQIDRASLAQIIFNNPEERARLEALLHPLVHDAQKDFLHKTKTAHHQIAALDIPLLFETGGEKRVNYTLVATAPFFIQRRRVLKRNGMNLEKFQKILNTQMPDVEKRRRADFIVPTGWGRLYTRFILHKILKDIKMREGL